MSDILEKFNSVFTDCEFFESIEDVLKARQEVELKHEIQPLYCNYQGQLRVVGDPVCRHHLETFDSWCWEKCQTEWSINRLRPPLSAAYKQHKNCTPQKMQFSFVDGLSGNLWGDR
jgi:hypothetical protein